LIVVMDGHGHDQNRDGKAVASRGEPTGWRDLAACHGLGPVPFYGSGSEAARRCCRRCEVDEICFWFAMATEEEAGYRFGVWAGTTPAVRAQVATVIGTGFAQRRFLALVGSGGRPSVRERS
jgi:hypothetical protein